MEIIESQREGLLLIIDENSKCSPLPENTTRQYLGNVDIMAANQDWLPTPRSARYQEYQTDTTMIFKRTRPAIIKGSSEWGKDSRAARR
ncbi:hypothetical protein RRG08_009899 [Elysia crispata]|uniref:Uncharacterized protein n=1 Tax=Elysia crispata TaxID=231223 RepID=A0AAE0YA20_9GAST|nr:hypothetical protein RRG08_009899 [Elysia crispata]